MLDACSASSMSSPRRVSENPASAKHGRQKLSYAAVAAICEHAPVPLTQPLDFGTPVMNRIVAIAGPAAGDRDHLEIRTPDEDLRIARPAVVIMK